MSSDVKALREEDLLLPFEKHALRDPFRLYICVKRNNRFATMQAFPQIWSAIQLLDSIWDRELRDLYTLIDLNDPLPLSLFSRAFARTRESFQLGLSGTVNEAADLMRGAVEYSIQGLRIKENPDLANIWMSKDKGKDEHKAFIRAFEKDKRDRLFKGQSELHRYWTKFSDWGSHSTIAALALRLRFTETESLKASFEFFETDQTRLADFLRMLLDPARRLEAILFDCFATRLMLDTILGDMRHRYNRLHNEICR